MSTIDIQALAASMDQTLLKPTVGFTEGAKWIEANRDKGYASLLMQKVCNEADNNSIVLMLTPNEGLDDFYKSFGFKHIQFIPVKLMARTHG